MNSFEAIFKAYDVRGTVPDQFDAEMARAIGAAFARFVLDEDPSVTQVLVAVLFSAIGRSAVAATRRTDAQVAALDIYEPGPRDRRTV